MRGFRGEQVRLFVRHRGADAAVCLPGACVQSPSGSWITSTDRQDRARSTAAEWWFVRCLDAGHGRVLISEWRARKVLREAGRAGLLPLLAIVDHGVQP